ncbi:MAG: FprA family A-type flavoprotein, partial [Candidatus Heimdallarchaeota archaeon]|nr:FprA family A-type flavoprotein [Candidatus Heimdallarchaeota archaeon]
MKEITEDVCYIGVNDHETDLFEGLWPIPEGVSYNSYLVKGEEKVAIIDLVKILFVDEFLINIEKKVNFDQIDYIVMNHIEPDHSGSL